MHIKDLRIGVKLLIPALISGLIMVAIGIFGAMRLAEVSAEANDIISRKDKAVVDSSRATRHLSQAESFVYASIIDDPSDEGAKAIVDGYNNAIRNVTGLFSEAASLLPEQAATFNEFNQRIEALKPLLQKAFDIGRTTPGITKGAALKPNELNALATGAGYLDTASVDMNKIITEATTLNARLLADNAARAAQMRADSVTVFWQILIAGLVGAALASGLTIKLSSAFVTAPLQSIAEAMRKLAGGDVSVAVPGHDRRDEVGQMASAVGVFKENALEKLRLEAAAADARRVADAEKAQTDAERAERARQQAQVVSGLAEGLDRLQAGKLTHRLEDAFMPEYERLRADFNGAIAKLQQTLGVVAFNATAIRSGTRDISSAADELSRRTEQQAANLEETSAAINQIADTVRKTSSGVNHARDLVLQAQSEAKSSGEVVQHAIGAMSDISASSTKISSIIAVIDEIAFQTNLLALNAGVEAARAGDAGKGFAVVASEVRALAQRSAEASKEIRSLIHDSAGRVDAGVELVGQTGEALTRIQSSIVKINEIIQDIAHSASEQASSLDEVSTAVRQMDLVTQQNAAMVEESTAATRKLADESDELARLIDEFEVGAKPAGGGRAAGRGDAMRALNSRAA